MWNGTSNSAASLAPLRIMSGLAAWMEWGAGWAKALRSPPSHEPPVVAEPASQGLEGVAVPVDRPRQDRHVAPVLAFFFGKPLGQVGGFPGRLQPSPLHDEGVAPLPAVFGENQVGGDDG